MKLEDAKVRMMVKVLSKKGKCRLIARIKEINQEDQTVVVDGFRYKDQVIPLVQIEPL